MITVIHGDDLANSRKHFIEQKEKAKNPIQLKGDKLTLSDIVQALEGSSLFSEEKNVFIENFLSQKKTNKQFKEIAEYIVKNKNNSEVYFWEDKEVTKTTISAFKNADSKLFKLPQSLFLFLDNLKPNSSKENVLYFHKAISRSAPELVYFMIVRQFRILFALTQKDHLIDELKRIAPWQRGKLEKQAHLFGEEKLKEILNNLYIIDYKQKYGLTSLPFIQNVDFFLAGI